MKIQGVKSPETLDAVGVQPTASKLGLLDGGDGEIRTLDTLMGYTRFPIVRARPATRHLHIAARLSSAYAVCCLTAKIIISAFPSKVKSYFKVF